MWTTKTFKTADAMRQWIERHDGLVQWEEIAVNNGYGVQYRKLRKVG